MIVKIRVSDVEIPLKNNIKKSSKKKIGKGEKKRLAAEKLFKADSTFDNPEESLLFQVNLLKLLFLIIFWRQKKYQYCFSIKKS